MATKGRSGGTKRLSDVDIPSRGSSKAMRPGKPNVSNDQEQSDPIKWNNYGQEQTPSVEREPR